jgi:DNA-binding transcriptional LysR family regulator
MNASASTNAGFARLTLRQLFYFVTVAEERQFHRAATRLHISQPPLTQRIQALERDLGVQLFTRTGNQIELTEAGRLVLAEAQAMLEQADRLREVARRAGQGEAGNLRVWIVGSVTFVGTFIEATAAFQRDHPGVVLDLVQTTARVAFEALQQGRIDVCILRRVAPSHLNGLQQMVIARDRLMLVLPSSHPKAHWEKVALADVAEERFIGYGIVNGGALQHQIMELWRRADLVPRVSQLCEHGAAILALVACGFGNAILPSTINGIHMPNVVWKPIDMDEQWTSSAIALLHGDDTRNEKVRSRFIEYVRRFSPESG